VALRPIVDHLTGVDVAPKMVETARGKGVYDALEVGDAVAYLRGDGPRFDLVASADVLIYVGDPEPLFAAVGARLAPGGRFAFTIERGEGSWRLEQHARYSHDPGYLERLAGEHGMRLAHQADFVLRREMGKPVPGVVMVLQRG
jgi:predicted TPR repeat methyltransferase